MPVTMDPESRTAALDSDKADRKLRVEQAGNVLEVEATSTEEEERAVVRKIDMVILPLMCFVFFLQYLDKQSLSYAAVSQADREVP